MSDIRFEGWLHKTGTGGVYQDAAGNVGIASTQPQTRLDIGNGAFQVGPAGICTVTTVKSTNIVNATTLSNRNVIRNGHMQVIQRGSPLTVNANVARGRCATDGWEISSDTNGTAVFSSSKSTDTPNGFGSSLKLNVTTADTSIASDVGTRFLQRFEGQELQRFKKGSSDALEWTLSFHVKSPKTGTHCIELLDIDHNRAVSGTYTISAANTWQYVSYTFPADTTGALDNDNDQSFIVLWWLAAGSTYNSGTLQTSWGTRVAANRAVGQVNVTDSTDNNFFITGCQLEAGSVATPYEHRSEAEELRRCHRYYQKLSGDSLSYFGVGNVDGATMAQILVNFVTEMRNAPSSLETSGTANHYTVRMNSNATGSAVPTLSNRTTKNALVIFYAASHGFTNGQGCFGRSASADAFLGFSSEL